MNEKTKEALQTSIQHWEKMRDDPLGCYKQDDGPDAKNCALCQRFFYDGKYCKNGSEKCPVYRKTKARCCGGSPYDDADRAWNVYRMDRKKRTNRKLWQAAAQKEIDFLKSLLPKS